jgi:hypothetical protein
MMHRQLAATAHAPDEMRVDLRRGLWWELSIGICAEQVDQNLMLILSCRAFSRVFG